MGAPSPKRRRTDNGTVSADSIAQANSTLHIFAGQRHNRWMQSVTQDTNGEVASRRQTASAATPTNRQQRDADAAPATFGGDDARSSLGPVHVSSSRQVPKRAAASNEAVTDRANLGTHSPGLTQYESPTLSTTSVPGILTDTNTIKLLERMARTGSQPGLPSPALSDENPHSPLTSGLNHPTNDVNSNDPVRLRTHSRGPGRPPLHHSRVASSGSATVGTGSPAQMNPQTRFRTSQGAAPTRNVHTPPLFGQFETAGVLPSNSNVQQSQQAEQSRTVALQMCQRVDTFQREKLSKHRTNNYDTGRLTLLRDAIMQQDWFYMVLSQIHSLSETPNLLPQAVSNLDPRSFSYLDCLLCANKTISPVLLRWLAEFPAPIMRIYSAPDTKGLYEMHLLVVKEFLERLALHWDGIVLESKQRRAPPLVQDLHDRLGLYSPVLQTTAFRAVSRMIWSDPLDQTCLEHLEAMHGADQLQFMNGRRWGPHEKHIGYWAYHRVGTAWMEHKAAMPLFERRQQQIPPAQRRPAPAFTTPAQAADVFQVRPASDVMSQASSLHVPTNARGQMVDNYLQHYQNTMASHDQIHGQRMLSSNGRASPAQHATNLQRQLGQMQMQNRNPMGLVPPQRYPPNARLVFPHEMDQPRAQPTQPDAVKSALHQAHLRSPIPAAAQLKPGATRLYRHVAAYALSPTRIEKDVPISIIPFVVPEASFKRIASTTPSAVSGGRSTRVLSEDSQTYRLRCCAITPSGFPSEAAWVVADNYWPDNIFLEINGNILETRRKLHHGRYLPIDLTGYIKPGDNEIKVIMNRLSTDQRPFEYALAVEIVDVRSHETITNLLKTISADKSLSTIKQSLSGTNEDDDLAVTSSNLTIKLFDPYSGAKIFDTPVRGKDCVHRDCFDFETFLAMCKREQPGWPSVVDCWRCPLCRGDVRPQTLIVDGFLIEVRKELARRGLLDTRAIVVEADGSWKPKAEERTGVRSASLEREERGTTSSSAAKKPMEVIEID